MYVVHLKKNSINFYGSKLDYADNYFLDSVSHAKILYPTFAIEIKSNSALVFIMKFQQKIFYIYFKFIYLFFNYTGCELLQS